MISRSKGASRLDPDEPACENFLISDCTFLHGHGMSVGSESYGGVRNMIVRDCTFDGTEAGIRLKSPPGRGGVAENLTYENLTMRNVKNSILITSYYPKIPTHPEQDSAQPVDERTPHLAAYPHQRTLRRWGATSPGRLWGFRRCRLMMLCWITCKFRRSSRSKSCSCAGIRFINCNISPSSGKPFLYDAKVEGLE